MSVIRLENVSKVFQLRAGQKLIRDHIRDLFRRKEPADQFFALKDISFTVSARESVAIIGANGAGKSTLLSLVVGLARPEKGRIEVDGRVAALLELGSGFHPELTGTENVLLNAALLGFNEKQAKEVMGQIVDFAEIGQFIHEPLRTYSAGMMVRLAFSVAVHVDPAILIVDEVLGVGDQTFQVKCQQRIRSYRDEGRTLLFVTHAMNTVLEMCDRAIWLDKGLMVMDGPVGDVVPAYLDYMADPLKGLPSQRVQAATAPKVRMIGQRGRRARAK